MVTLNKLIFTISEIQWLRDFPNCEVNVRCTTYDFQLFTNANAVNLQFKVRLDPRHLKRYSAFSLL